MKIEQVRKNFKDCEAVFICPICQAPLKVNQQGSFACLKNHCFDFSSKGYINLIPNYKHNSKNYSKKLFESRKKIFAAGFYEPVFHEIRDLTINQLGKKSTLNVLDAGCGEGYYSLKLAETPKLQGRACILAMDIARDAVSMAGSSPSPVKWMVADLTEIPLRQGTMDVILNILTSANYKEFFRILAPDGIIIKVIPGTEYLREIRSLIETNLRSKEYSNERVTDYFERHAKILEKRTLHFQMPVDEESMRCFLAMTPMTFHVDTANISVNHIRNITIHLEILIGRQFCL